MRKIQEFVLCALVLVPTALGAQSMAGGTTNGRLAAFGTTVGVVETDVLIGEPSNNTRPGTVYVYRKAGSTWREAVKLTGSDGRPQDGFGVSLATDGNRILVGAPAQDESRGAGYVFERTGNSWRQVARLTAESNPGDAVGSVVALHGDHAVLSSFLQGRQTGVAYVFKRSGESWTQIAKLVSNEPKEQAQFGRAVAFVGDTILISEPGFNNGTGALLEFKPNGQGGYNFANRIAPTNLRANERFGQSLAARGSELFVAVPGANSGAGFVIAYKHGERGWREFRRLSAFEGWREAFGSSIAFDGNQLWIGAAGSNQNRGHVYHYWRAAADSLWSGVERFTVENNDAGDRFGNAVASRGNIAVIGMVGDDFNAGTAVVMELIGNAWKQTALIKTPPEGFQSITGRKVECTDGKAAGFDCSEYDLVSFLSIQDIGGARGVRLSGNWGWTDPQTGREYGLIGRVDGTSVVDLTDPEKPVFVANIPKTKEAQSSSWREIKTYRNWALIVSDGSGPHGIQFVDLTRLRQYKGTPLQLEPDHTYRSLASIHNIVVNEEADFAAAVGANGGGETCGGGLHMLDIKDPKNPVFLGCFADRQTGRSNTGYSHDALCLTYKGPDRDYAGREICLGSNETMLSIADVTDRKAPRAISRAGYPNVGYTHQGWYDAEQRYFYMNDELDEVGGLTPKTRTIIWDLTDLDDPQVVGEFLGTTAASDHNLYVIGDLMYQSNYQAGLRIIDIKDRRNPKEVGYFDTVPYGTNGPGFGGSWNNYPFFKSGNIVVSSGGEGVFIVRKKAPKVVS